MHLNELLHSFSAHHKAQAYTRVIQGGNVDVSWKERGKDQQYPKQIYRLSFWEHQWESFTYQSVVHPTSVNEKSPVDVHRPCYHGWLCQLQQSIFSLFVFVHCYPLFSSPITHFATFYTHNLILMCIEKVPSHPYVRNQVFKWGVDAYTTWLYNGSR